MQPHSLCTGEHGEIWGVSKVEAAQNDEHQASQIHSNPLSKKQAESSSSECHFWNYDWTDFHRRKMRRTCAYKGAHFGPLEGCADGRSGLLAGESSEFVSGGSAGSSESSVQSVPGASDSSESLVASEGSAG